MIAMHDSVYAKVSHAARPQRQNTPVCATPPDRCEDCRLRAGSLADPARAAVMRSSVPRSSDHDGPADQRREEATRGSADARTTGVGSHSASLTPYAARDVAVRALKRAGCVIATGL